MIISVPTELNCFHREEFSNSICTSPFGVTAPVAADSLGIGRGGSSLGGGALAGTSQAEGKSGKWLEACRSVERHTLKMLNSASCILRDRKKNFHLYVISKSTIISVVCFHCLYIEYYGQKKVQITFHRILCVHTSDFSVLKEPKSLFPPTSPLCSHLCRNCPPSAVVPAPESGTFPCSTFFLRWPSLSICLLFTTY